MTESDDGTATDSYTGARALSSDAERLEERRDLLEDEHDRLARGEPELPWPGNSKLTFALAGASILMAGGLLGYTATLDGGAPFIFAAVIATGAGAGLVSYGRWVNRHFETGEAPTYSETPVDHGGDA